MQMTTNRGFTMVEMMMVVMVLAILMAIALPSMRVHMANAEIRGISEEMRSGLELARSEAIRRNTSVRFTRNGSGWNVVIPGTGGVADQQLTMRAPRETPVAVTTSAETITFNASGWTTPFGSTMTINLQAPATNECKPAGGLNCLTVAVAAGGLVRSCDPAATAGTVTACN